MLVKHHLIATAELPAAAVSQRTFRAVPAAEYRIAAGGRRTVTVPDVRLREIVRIDHLHPLPGAEDHVQVLRNNPAVAEKIVHDLVLLGEAEDLALRIASGNVNHVREVIVVRHVAGHVESEKSRHHY